MLNPVYVGPLGSGGICVFSRIDDAVRIWLPNGFGEKLISMDLAEWRRLASSYREPNDLSLYDEVVNAAWQRLTFSRPLIKSEVRISKTGQGKHHPRIWRGLYDQKNAFCYNPVRARRIYGSHFIRATAAAASVFEHLEEVFRYVEPASANLASFGNKIREILILSCTDVEASWRAVLDSNVATLKSRYNTHDYIKIKNALRLSDWEVYLYNYPDLGPIRPFKDWSEVDPSKSLPWYHAYNAVKHHRDVEFANANLENLVHAAAAVHVLQAAQWGPEIYDRLYGNLPSPFVVTGHPVYELSELYVPTLDENLEGVMHFA